MVTVKKLLAMLVLAGLLGSTLGCGSSSTPSKAATPSPAPGAPDKKADESKKP
jgi:hypothetical protein